jgi:FkbM family methyltransferase
VVIDLGGYEGQWAADIFCKYACNIHIFEPFKEFAKNIESRFNRNSKVTIYNYGLSKANTVEKLNISADSSSTFKDGNESVEIQLIKIDDFLDKHNINHIDLMKINIEGGEYDLLEYLVQSERILLFENIQVQFHDFVPNAVDRMHTIQSNLSKTHYLTFQYEFVWENWKLKK